MNKKAITLSVACIALIGGALFAFTPTASAQDVTYTPLVTLPGVLEKGQPTNPVEILKGFYGLAIGIGSIIAVIMIIFAGFKYMYQESIDGKSGARDQITNAFIGLLVILASYIILRTINADLVNFNLNLPGGEGRVSGLVADSAIDAYQQQLRFLGVANEAIRKKEASVAALDGEIAAKQKEIADLGCAQSPTKEGCDAKKTELAALQTRRAEENKTLTTEKIKQQSALGQLNVKEKLVNDVAQEMKHLRTDNWSEEPNTEGIDFDTFLDKAGGVYTKQISMVQSRIAAIDGIQAVDEETNAQKAQALKQLNDEKKYLEIAAKEYFNKGKQDPYNNNSTDLDGLVAKVDARTTQYAASLKAEGFSDSFISERVARDKDLLLQAYSGFEEVQEDCRSSGTDKSKYPSLCGS